MTESAKEGCELLVKRLADVQKGKEKEKNKGWGFNLCGGCDCDWDKAEFFRRHDGDLKIVFKDT